MKTSIGKVVLSLGFYCFISLIVNTQVVAQSDSLQFPILKFSQQENYHHVSVNGMLSPQPQTTFTFEEYQYLVPFGTGIRKDVMERDNFLMSVDASINVHFIFRYENSRILKGIRKTHYNTDFFVRWHNTFSISNDQKIRLTAFHRSTHLGDDYVVLNPFPDNNYWSTDETNYEAIQVQYAVEKEKYMVYAGGRYITRPDTPRERIEFQHGAILQHFLKGQFGEKVFLGYDVKLLQNNDFNFDLDAGMGYELGDKSHIRLQYYVGHIPFSRLERLYNSSWIGLGYYLEVSSL